jgi:hypothetical protein
MVKPKLRSGNLRCNCLQQLSVKRSDGLHFAAGLTTVKASGHCRSQLRNYHAVKSCGSTSRHNRHLFIRTPCPFLKAVSKKPGSFNREHPGIGKRLALLPLFAHAGRFRSRLCSLCLPQSFCTGQCSITPSSITTTLVTFPKTRTCKKASTARVWCGRLQHLLRLTGILLRGSHMHSIANFLHSTRGRIIVQASPYILSMFYCCFFC